MVLKRIISCFAMVSIALLVSCHDVQYDENTATNEANWTEGLTSQQIMEGMEIEGSIADTSVVSKEDATTEEKEVGVVWEWPAESDQPEWEVSYIIDDDPSTETTVFGPAEIPLDTTEKLLLIPTVTATVSGDLVVYTINFKLTFSSAQTLLAVKIKMKDSNGACYSNTVTFLVAPKAMTCTIRPGESEAAATSNLYKTQISILQLVIDFLTNPSHGTYLYKADNIFTIPTEGTVWTIDPCRLVFFGIETDLTSRGLGIVRHHSSSSYCKVTKICPAQNGAFATFKYSFEDLPKTQIRYEDGNRFDYDDVQFYIDIRK